MHKQISEKVLILGVTGMLGHTLFNYLFSKKDLDLYGTARTDTHISEWFAKECVRKILTSVSVDDFDALVDVFAEIQPDIVINCIGLIKQLPSSNNPLNAITINAQLPHKIALLCKTYRTRMIHISTDCVFSGQKGNYTENDPADATDLYGRTKFLGEVYYPNTVTLRTSIIGHELKNKYGLIEWFLSQENKIKGYTNVIYSGFPTIEFARIIADYVISNPQLTGLYHVSSAPISKYDLLKSVAKKYKKQINIEPYDAINSDRSLNSGYFKSITGYSSPCWDELIDKMYRHRSL